MAAITASPGAKAHYRRRRDNHAAAQRNLVNRMIGQLYHCLQQDTFPAPPDQVGAAAV